MKTPNYKNKFLLFDDLYTDKKSGFKTTLNQVQKEGEAVLFPDRTWERAGFCGDSMMTILKEHGIYKMWYGIFDPEHKKDANSILSNAKPGGTAPVIPDKFTADALCSFKYYLCYATSKDGIHWEKDNLGLYEIDGNKDNNIVLSGRIGATVFIDPNAEADKKYKMIHGGSSRLPHWMKQENKFVRMAYAGIYGAYSPDGIHWTSTEKQIMPWYTDSTNVCYWDDAIKKYVAYVRTDKDMIFEDGKTVMTGAGHNTYRIISRSESEDFENFPPPINVLEPEPEEVDDYYKGDTCNNGLDFYNSSAIKYPFADNTYFMFPSYFYHASDTLDVHISTSRNGIDYTRHDEPFLGLEKVKGAKQIYMATGMISENKYIHMYYQASKVCHGETTEFNPDEQSSIGRISFRKDGFISQDAADEGVYTTTPIRIDNDCNYIKVNLETSESGFMRCALLKASGETIADMSADNSAVITGSHSSIKMSWKGVNNLESLQGQDIKIRFIGKAIKLYSFELSSC